MMARPSIKFASIKSSKQRQQLVDIWKTHSCHYTRMRAHAILLSDQGYEVSALVDIFGVDRDSISSWIDRFETGGPDAIQDSDRPGAPPALDKDEQEILRKLFALHPNRPAKVLTELKQKTGKEISTSTLRKYAHRLGLSWKRFRRSLRQKRDEKAFRVAQQELAEMLQEPSLNVVYFDESGFSLKGVVPYGWQPKGERLNVPVTGSHGSSVQVLGFESEDGKVESFLHKGNVDSETVIAVLDSYSETISQTTVVVVDNAPYHTSAAFQACLQRWAARGLLIYPIPPYSPELNRIERFWKTLKYQLMPVTAWERFTTLLQTLTTKLCEIGVVHWMPTLRHYAE
jgi:transposase